MEFEAVTIDAYGTLVTLRDPVPALRAALADRDIERSAADANEAGARAAGLRFEPAPLADAAQRILA